MDLNLIKYQKILALIHSLRSTKGALIVSFSDWTQKNLISGSHPNTLNLLNIESEYLLNDLLIHLLLKQKNLLMIVHHVLFLILAQVSKYRIERKLPAAEYFISNLMLMNASTCILELRWLLKHFGYKHRFLDVPLLLTFISCRILIFLPLFNNLAKRQQITIKMAFKSIPKKCQWGTGAIIILNTIWALKLTLRIAANK